MNIITSSLASISTLFVRLSERAQHDQARIRAHSFRVHNSSPSAVKLPMEILSQIFILACFSPPRFKDRNCAFQEVARHMASTRTSVALTCRRWRDVTECTKALRCMVSVSNSQHLSRYSSLNRSTGTRMSVHLHNLSLQQDTPSLLGPYLSKAEYLRYRMDTHTNFNNCDPLIRGHPVPLPYLRKLAVENNGNITRGETLHLTHAPHLESLYFFSITRLRLRLAPQCQLRDLTLEYWDDSDNIRDVLQACPVLETLCLRGSELSTMPQSNKQTLTHSQLRRLILHHPDGHGSSNYPLKSIQCPNLEAWSLVFRSAMIMDSVMCPSLSYLSVYLTAWYYGSLKHLKSLFESCNSVTRLALVDQGRLTLARKWLSDLLQSSHIFPKLEYLETDLYLKADSDRSSLTRESVHPQALDLRLLLTLILPNEPRSHRYLEMFPAYASRIEISSGTDFPEISKHAYSWHETAEGWC